MKGLGEQVVQLVHRIVRPLQARVDNLILRAVLRSANDSGGYQVVEVGALGEGLSGAELAQPGGISHVPVAGAEGVVLNVRGRRSHPVAILFSNRALRPKNLAPGETALWTALPLPNGGARLTCKANGEVWVVGGAQYVALANLVLAELNAIKTWADTHIHTATGATAPTTVPTVLMTAPGSVASTKLKSD